MVPPGNSTADMKRAAILLSVLFVVLSCGGRKSSATATASTEPTAPEFCADSAYNYIRKQTDFGPRVPNTDAQLHCAAWLMKELAGFGAKTYLQEFETVTFDNTKIRCYNIIGSINPESPARIILCSHWDSRPWADNDPDPANWMKPVDAANDGASGVGVILEIARQLQKKAPEIGVDCIFFDAEDWGPGENYQGMHLESYWGLGTQYWAKKPHKEGYKARYAILLDMVGGKGAAFCREMYSVMFNKPLVDKVWGTAGKLGYGSLFLPIDGSYVTDDHYFINTIAKIPSIDIVPYLPQCKQSIFGPTWHTTQDNINNIDKNVLEAVGKTLLQVIYNEKP